MGLRTQCVRYLRCSSFVLLTVPRLSSYDLWLMIWSTPCPLGHAFASASDPAKASLLTSLCPLSQNQRKEGTNSCSLGIDFYGSPLIDIETERKD